MEEKVLESQESVAVEKISEVDRLALEVAKSAKKLAAAQTEKALAQSETADIAYKYTVLQVFMKYGLTNKDSIDESTGTIVRNKG